MQFKEVEVSDGRWARELLEAGAPKSCEYCFADIFMWSGVFNTRIARYDDLFIARGEGEHTMHYLYPAGRGERRAAIDAILADAAGLGKRPMLYSVPKDAFARLEAWYPNQFTFEDPRGQADYIYKAEDLALLGGKKYQKKRNHCSRFERSYPDWAFYEIGPEAMTSLVAFNNNWTTLYENQFDAGIADEHTAVDKAFSHYEELGLYGGYITTGGEIVAFSFGSSLGGDTFVTHVEKALYDIPGAYNIINREMARRLVDRYRYINRENDLDSEGLRTAKLSYHPAWLEPKYAARWH